MPLELADLLRARAALHPAQHEDVFAKVGDSITVSTSFLHCFSSAAVDLGAYGALSSTLELFRAGDAAGVDPFRRVSLVATVGWSATSAIAGTPSPLEREVSALAPRHALVMFGTNDVEARSVWQYEGSMLTLVDQLLATGIIPHLSTVPPRDDSAAANRLVPRFNAVVRAIAQGRQIPLVDLHRELLPLPSHGLGPDGVHPNSYAASVGARPCALTESGLRFGFNVRNLLSLTTLHRATLALSPGTAAPDPELPTGGGDGSPERPFEIDALPFSDLRDTRESPNSRFDRYAGCAAPQDESGPEVVYRIVVRAAMTVRAMVFAQGAADIDVHLLSGPFPESCVARHDRELVATLTAGTHYFSLDTFVTSAGERRAGEYLFVLVEEP